MAEQPIPQREPAEAGPAAALDMPPERRRAAMAHAALLSETAAKVAADLPLGADVDDFRRILAAEARP
ncbi:MAG TPA: hypothetical protein VFR19_11950 [Hyphomicrobiaceae bacterium]|nr:hypothetical protein [Hyphomicrobiaceae bacterium]